MTMLVYRIFIIFSHPVISLIKSLSKYKQCFFLGRDCFPKEHKLATSQNQHLIASSEKQIHLIFVVLRDREFKGN